MKRFIYLAATALGLLTASTASAQVVAYTMDDHSGRSLTNWEYGLRLDDLSLFFTAQAGNANLVWDQGADKAFILGSINLDLPGAGIYDGTWHVLFQMDTTDFTQGTFDGFYGNSVIGTIWNDISRYDMVGKSDGVSHSVLRAPGYRGETRASYEGWVMDRGDCNTQFGFGLNALIPTRTCASDSTFTGTNDWLVGLTRNPSIISSPVPVPAALPMLAAGLGGLALFRRRNKKT